MNRAEFEKYIFDTYSVSAERPWMKYPDNTVFRHESNRKWFAIVMPVLKSRLGIDSQEKLDVVNLKCDPILLGSLLEQKGFYPAYHMNKENWVSVALDGSVDDSLLKWLLESSFNRTL